QLQDLAGRWEQLESTKASLQTRLASLAAEEQRLAHESTQRSAESLASYEAERQKLSEQASAMDGELTEINRQLERLRPFADARRGGRWWTLRWWRARLRGDVLAKERELHEARDRAAEQQRAIQDSLERLSAGYNATQQRLADERQRGTGEDLAGQRHAFAAEETQLADAAAGVPSAAQN